MINVTINSHRVYPLLSSPVKVVYENTLIKERDTRSFEIEFPLDIPENIAVLGHLNRIDVSSQSPQIGLCEITADSVTILSGTATVTAISEKSVKVQVKSGPWQDDIEQLAATVYLDQLTLLPDEWESRTYPFSMLGSLADQTQVVDGLHDVTQQLATYHYIGRDGIAVFPCLYDTTRERTLNKITCKHWENTRKEVFVSDLAPQFSLMFVLGKVWQRLGYTVVSNEYDCRPWNRMYIASADGKLPVWTLKKFLQEFRHLFNAAYEINGHNVSVVSAATHARSVVTPECVDEFTTDYDEDGIEMLSSSNIAYPSDVFTAEHFDPPHKEAFAPWPENFDTAYPTRTYASLQAAAEAVGGMSWDESFRTIFALPSSRYYLNTRPVDENPSSWHFTQFGRFIPLVRDADSSNAVELHIVPAAVDKAVAKYARMSIPESGTAETSERYTNRYAPCVEYADNSTLPGIRDIFENDEELPERKEDETMSVFLMVTSSEPDLLSTQGSDRMYVYLTDGLVDSDVHDGYYEEYEASMVLDRAAAPYIGQFHPRAAAADRHVKYEIKFLSDVIPDPKSVFVFHGKSFECDHVEVSFDAEGFDRLMTGYFYRML